MKVTITNLTIFSLLFTGCMATKPNAIMPKLKENQYLKYSCSELEIKANKITSQSIELQKQLKEDSDFDGAMFAIGILIAWPVLFAIQGDDKDTTKIYSKIKGELLNIQEADILNECNIPFSNDTLNIVSIY